MYGEKNIMLTRIENVNVRVGKCESDSDDDEKSEDEKSEDEKSENVESEDSENSSRYGDCNDTLVIESALFALGSIGYTFAKRIHVHGNVGVYSGIVNDNPVCVKIICSTKKVPMDARILRHMNDNAITCVPVLLDVYMFCNEHGTASILVMNLLEEHSISENVFGNTEVIRKLITQLIEIIQNLHSIGILYRDLKMSNLLWNNDTEILGLCDFDLSTFITEKGHTACLGTEGYMAPEMLAFDRHPPISDDLPKPYSHSIDIYGIGAILGACLNEVHELDLGPCSVHRWRSIYRKKDNRSSLESLFLQLTEYEPENRITLNEALEYIKKNE